MVEARFLGDWAAALCLGDWVAALILGDWEAALCLGDWEATLCLGDCLTAVIEWTNYYAAGGHFTETWERSRYFVEKNQSKHPFLRIEN